MTIVAAVTLGTVWTVTQLVVVVTAGTVVTVMKLNDRRKRKIAKV